MSSSRKAIISGSFYAIASMLNAGIVFFTTPYFTRVMSQHAYGEYNNFLSWYNIVSVASLNLGSTLISARNDYKDDIESYVTSIAILNFVLTAFLAIVASVFRTFCENFLNLEYPYILLMLTYVAFYQVFLVFQAKERFSFRYRMSVFLTVFHAVFVGFLSVILVNKINNQVLARVLGNVIPVVAVGGIACVLFLKDSKKLKLRYWKYAVPICVPYIPHLLSLTVLNSSDKTMITSMVGSKATAIYSLAYVCGSTVSLVVGVLNNAFAPWLSEKINNKEYRVVYKVSRVYIVIFALITGGILLLAPEILHVLGGSQYQEAIMILPVIIIGCSLQLIYTLYVNIEQINKKTIGMAIVSIIAALANVLLNLYFIPICGYQIAAYTTLIGYLILALGHIVIVKKMYFSVYDDKLSIFFICVSVVEVPICLLLYSNINMRVVVIILYVTCIIILLKKYYKTIKKLLLSKSEV